MRGADTVDDEFEVGFNQRFETAWHRAEKDALIRFNLAPGALRPVSMTPAVVYEHGRFNDTGMHQLRLTKPGIMIAAGQRGLMRPEQLRYAVTERDGEISIVETAA